MAQGGAANFSIPTQFGRTRISKSVDAGCTLIHIEDAHDSLEAQKKIVSILGVLASDYDVRTIALEGGAGEMDTALFKTYPDQTLAKKAAEDLVKEGRLNAGEFFALTSEMPISVYGAEEKTLYRENLKAFRDLLKNKEKIEKDLKGLCRSIEVLKERVYSDPLKEMERNRTLALEEEKGFTRRWERLKALAMKKNVSLDGYDELKTLDAVSSLEKEIDFAKANEERSKLLLSFRVPSNDGTRNLIQRRSLAPLELTKADAEALVLKSLDYKSGKIGDSDFYIFLSSLASRYEISLAPYSDLARYMRYLALFDSLDLTRVFEEIEKFEEEVRAATFENDDQRSLASLSTRREILNDLVTGEASSKTFERFSTHPEDFDRERYLTELSGLLSKYHVPSYEGMKPERIFDALKIAHKFYSLAEKRNQVLLERTLARMKAEGTHVAALVTGGFHTQGISQLIENKGLSYLVVLPKITDPKSKRPYVTIITRQKGEYVKSLGSPASKFKIMLGAPLYKEGSSLTDLRAILSKLANGLSPEVLRKWMQAYRLAGPRLDTTKVESILLGMTRKAEISQSSRHLTGLLRDDNTAARLALPFFWLPRWRGLGWFKRYSLVNHAHLRSYAVSMGAERSKAEQIVREIADRSSLVFRFRFDVWKFDLIGWETHWGEVWETDGDRATDLKERVASYFMALRFLTPGTGLYQRIDRKLYDLYLQERTKDYLSLGSGAPSIQEVNIAYGGSDVPAYWIVPNGAQEGQTPAAVFLHGLHSRKEEPFFNDLEKKLIARGIAILRVDLPRHGANEVLAERSNDTSFLDAILKYLGSFSVVDIQNIHLVGESLGGGMAIRGLLDKQTGPLIRTVSVINPPVHHIFKNPRMILHLARPYLEYVLGTRDGSELINKIDSYAVTGQEDWFTRDHAHRLLYIYGEKDRLLPAEEVNKAREILRESPTYVSFPEGRHRFSGPSAKQAFDRIVAHIEAHRLVSALQSEVMPDFLRRLNEALNKDLGTEEFETNPWKVNLAVGQDLPKSGFQSRSTKTRTQTYQIDPDKVDWSAFFLEIKQRFGFMYPGRLQRTEKDVPKNSPNLDQLLEEILNPPGPTAALVDPEGARLARVTLSQVFSAVIGVVLLFLPLKYRVLPAGHSTQADLYWGLGTISVVAVLLFVAVGIVWNEIREDQAGLKSDRLFDHWTRHRSSQSEELNAFLAKVIALLDLSYQYQVIVDRQLHDRRGLFFRFITRWETADLLEKINEVEIRESRTLLEHIQLLEGSFQDEFERYLRQSPLKGLVQIALGNLKEDLSMAKTLLHNGSAAITAASARLASGARLARRDFNDDRVRLAREFRFLDRHAANRTSEKEFLKIKPDVFALAISDLNTAWKKYLSGQSIFANEDIVMGAKTVLTVKTLAGILVIAVIVFADPTFFVWKFLFLTAALNYFGLKYVSDTKWYTASNYFHVLLLQLGDIYEEIHGSHPFLIQNALNKLWLLMLHGDDKIAALAYQTLRKTIEQIDPESDLAVRFREAESTLLGTSFLDPKKAFEHPVTGKKDVRPDGSNVSDLFEDGTSWHAGARLTEAPIKAVGGPKSKDFISPIEYGKRISGLLAPFYHLLHRRSWGLGNFESAIRMVRVFKKLGLKIFQFLPMIWSAAFNSPYSEDSSRAIDIRFISVPMLVDGLKEEIKDGLDLDPYDRFLSLNYARIGKARKDKTIRHEEVLSLTREALEIVWRSLKASPSFEASATSERFNIFKKEQADWLPDHMLYLILKEKYQKENGYNGWDWRTWPEAIRKREGSAVEALKSDYRDEIEFFSFMQFVAYDQYRQFRKLATADGVEPALDIPFARGGADIWMNPGVFGLKEENDFQRPFTHGSLPEESYSVGQYWQFFAYDWSDPETLPYFLKLFEHYQKMAPYLRIDHALGFYMPYLFMEDGKSELTLKNFGIYDRIQDIVSDAKSRAAADLSRADKIRNIAAQQVSELFIQTLKTHPRITGNPLLKKMVDLAYPKGSDLSRYAMMYVAREAKDVGGFNYETLPAPWTRVDDVVEHKVFNQGPVWHYLRLTDHEFAGAGGLLGYLFDGEGPQANDGLRIAAYDRGPGEALFAPILEMAQKKGTTVIFETLARFTPEELKTPHLTAYDYNVAMWGVETDDRSNAHNPASNRPFSLMLYSLHDSDTLKGDWKKMSLEKKKRILSRLGIPQKARYLRNLTPRVHAALLRLTFSSNAFMVVPTLLDILGYPNSRRLNIPGRKYGQWVNPISPGIEDLEAATDGKPASVEAQKAADLIRQLVQEREELNSKSAKHPIVRIHPDAASGRVQIRQFEDAGNSKIHPFQIEAYVRDGEEVSAIINYKDSDGKIGAIEVPMVKDETAAIGDGVTRWVAWLEPTRIGRYEFQVKASASSGTSTLSYKGVLYAVAKGEDLNPVSKEYFGRKKAYSALSAARLTSLPSDVRKQIKQIVQLGLDAAQGVGIYHKKRSDRLHFRVREGKFVSAVYEPSLDQIVVTERLNTLLRSRTKTERARALETLKMDILLGFSREFLRQNRNGAARGLVEKNIQFPPQDDPSVYRSLSTQFMKDVLSGANGAITGSDLRRAADKLAALLEDYPYGYMALRGLAGYIRDGYVPDRRDLDMEKIWAPWDFLNIFEDVYRQTHKRNEKTAQWIEHTRSSWRARWEQHLKTMSYDEFYEVSVKKKDGSEALSPKATPLGVEFNLPKDPLEVTIYDELIRLGFGSDAEERGGHGDHVLSDLSKLLGVKRDPREVAKALALHAQRHPELVSIAGNFLENKQWGMDEVRVNGKSRKIWELHKGWNVRRSAVYSKDKGWTWAIACDVPPSAFKEPKHIQYKFVIRHVDDLGKTYDFWLPDPSVEEYTHDGHHNSVIKVGPKKEEIDRLTQREPSPGVVSLQLNLGLEAPAPEELAQTDLENPVQWLTANLDSARFNKYKRIQLATTLTLGNAPWLSGYGPAAYTSDLGQTEDFRALEARAKKLGVELVYDFVGGHTDPFRDPLPSSSYSRADFSDGDAGVIGTWASHIDDQNPESVAQLLWWIQAVGIPSIRADVGGSISQWVFLQRFRQAVDATTIIEERNTDFQAPFIELYFEDFFDVLERAVAPVSFDQLLRLLEGKLGSLLPGKRLLMIWNNHDKSQYHGGMGAFVRGLAGETAQKKLMALYTAYIIMHLTHLNRTSVMEYSPDRFGFTGRVPFMFGLYGRRETESWGGVNQDFVLLHDTLLDLANAVAANKTPAHKVETNNAFVGAAVVTIEGQRSLIVTNISGSPQKGNLRIHEEDVPFDLSAYEVSLKDLPPAAARLSEVKLLWHRFSRWPKLKWNNIFYHLDNFLIRRGFKARRRPIDMVLMQKKLEKILGRPFRITLDGPGFLPKNITTFEENPVAKALVFLKTSDLPQSFEMDRDQVGDVTVPSDPLEPEGERLSLDAISFFHDDDPKHEYTLPQEPPIRIHQDKKGRAILEINLRYSVIDLNTAVLKAFASGDQKNVPHSALRSRKFFWRWLAGRILEILRGPVITPSLIKELASLRSTIESSDLVQMSVLKPTERNTWKHGWTHMNYSIFKEGRLVLYITWILSSHGDIHLLSLNGPQIRAHGKPLIVSMDFHKDSTLHAVTKLTSKEIREAKALLTLLFEKSQETSQEKETRALFERLKKMPGLSLDPDEELLLRAAAHEVAAVVSESVFLPHQGIPEDHHYLPSSERLAKNAAWEPKKLLATLRSLSQKMIDLLGHHKIREQFKRDFSKGLAVYYFQIFASYKQRLLSYGSINTSHLGHDGMNVAVMGPGVEGFTWLSFSAKEGKDKIDHLTLVDINHFKADALFQFSKMLRLGRKARILSADAADRRILRHLREKFDVIDVSYMWHEIGRTIAAWSEEDSNQADLLAADHRSASRVRAQFYRNLAMLLKPEGTVEIREHNDLDSLTDLYALLGMEVKQSRHFNINHSRFDAIQPVPEFTMTLKLKSAAAPARLPSGGRLAAQLDLEAPPVKTLSRFIDVVSEMAEAASPDLLDRETVRHYLIKLFEKDAPGVIDEAKAQDFVNRFGNRIIQNVALADDSNLGHLAILNFGQSGGELTLSFQRRVIQELHWSTYPNLAELLFVIGFRHYILGKVVNREDSEIRRIANLKIAEAVLPEIEAGGERRSATINFLNILLEANRKLKRNFLHDLYDHLKGLIDGDPSFNHIEIEPSQGLEDREMLTELIDAAHSLEPDQISFGQQFGPPMNDGTGKLRFEIVSNAPLGKGSFGTVYKAVDYVFGKPVAVKVIGELAGPSLAKRVMSEWSLMRAVASSYTPVVYFKAGLTPAEPRGYIVMTFAEGESLAKLIKQDRLTPRLKIQIAQKIAEGLLDLRPANIIHRDIKPENINVDIDFDKEQVKGIKILDFGLAKQTKYPGELDADVARLIVPSPVSNSLTKGIVGTVSYISPEATFVPHEDQDVLHPTLDIFALGVILYSLFTGGKIPGRPDTEGEVNVMGVMTAQIHADYPSPRQINGEVDPELDYLIMKLLSPAFQGMSPLYFGSLLHMGTKFKRWDPQAHELVDADLSNLHGASDSVLEEFIRTADDEKLLMRPGNLDEKNDEVVKLIESYYNNHLASARLSRSGLFRVLAASSLVGLFINIFIAYPLTPFIILRSVGILVGTVAVSWVQNSDKETGAKLYFRYALAFLAGGAMAPLIQLYVGSLLAWTAPALVNFFLKAYVDVLLLSLSVNLPFFAVMTLPELNWHSDQKLLDYRQAFEAKVVSFFSRGGFFTINTIFWMVIAVYNYAIPGAQSYVYLILGVAILISSLPLASYSVKDPAKQNSRFSFVYAVPLLALGLSFFSWLFKESTFGATAGDWLTIVFSSVLASFLAPRLGEFYLKVGLKKFYIPGFKKKPTPELLVTVDHLGGARLAPIEVTPLGHVFEPVGFVPGHPNRVRWSYFYEVKFPDEVVEKMRKRVGSPSAAGDGNYGLHWVKRSQLEAAFKEVAPGLDLSVPVSYADATKNSFIYELKRVGLDPRARVLVSPESAFSSKFPVVGGTSAQTVNLAIGNYAVIRAGDDSDPEYLMALDLKQVQRALGGKPNVVYTLKFPGGTARPIGQGREELLSRFDVHNHGDHVRDKPYLDNRDNEDLRIRHFPVNRLADLDEWLKDSFPGGKIETDPLRELKEELGPKEYRLFNATEISQIFAARLALLTEIADKFKQGLEGLPELRRKKIIQRALIYGEGMHGTLFAPYRDRADFWEEFVDAVQQLQNFVPKIKRLAEPDADPAEATAFAEAVRFIEIVASFLNSYVNEGEFGTSIPDRESRLQILTGIAVYSQILAYFEDTFHPQIARILRNAKIKGGSFTPDLSAFFAAARLAASEDESIRAVSDEPIALLIGVFQPETGPVDNKTAKRLIATALSIHRDQEIEEGYLYTDPSRQTVMRIRAVKRKALNTGIMVHLEKLVYSGETPTWQPFAINPKDQFFTFENKTIGYFQKKPHAARLAQTPDFQGFETAVINDRKKSSPIYVNHLVTRFGITIGDRQNFNKAIALLAAHGYEFKGNSELGPVYALRGARLAQSNSVDFIHEQRAGWKAVIRLKIEPANEQSAFLRFGFNGWQNVSELPFVHSESEGTYEIALQIPYEGVSEINFVAYQGDRWFKNSDGSDFKIEVAPEFYSSQFARKVWVNGDDNKAYQARAGRYLLRSMGSDEDIRHNGSSLVGQFLTTLMGGYQDEEIDRVAVEAVLRMLRALHENYSANIDIASLAYVIQDTHERYSAWVRLRFIEGILAMWDELVFQPSDLVHLNEQFGLSSNADYDDLKAAIQSIRHRLEIADDIARRYTAESISSGLEQVGRFSSAPQDAKAVLTDLFHTDGKLFDDDPETRLILQEALRFARQEPKRRAKPDAKLAARLAELKQIQELVNRHASGMQNSLQGPSVDFLMVRDDQNDVFMGVDKLNVTSSLTRLDKPAAFKSSNDFAAGEKRGFGQVIRPESVLRVLWWISAFWGRVQDKARWLRGYFLILPSLFSLEYGIREAWELMLRYTRLLRAQGPLLASLNFPSKPKYTANFTSNQAARLALSGSNGLAQGFEEFDKMKGSVFITSYESPSKPESQRIVYVNQAFLTAVGGGVKSDWVGKNYFDKNPRELALQYTEDDVTAMRKYPGEYIHLTESNQSGDKPVTVETVKLPFYDADGRWVGVLGMDPSLRRTLNRVRGEQKKRTRDRRFALTSGEVIDEIRAFITAHSDHPSADIQAHYFGDRSVALPAVVDHLQRNFKPYTGRQLFDLRLSVSEHSNITIEITRSERSPRAARLAQTQVDWTKLKHRLSGTDRKSMDDFVALIVADHRSDIVGQIEDLYIKPGSERYADRLLRRLSRATDAQKELMAWISPRTRTAGVEYFGKKLIYLGSNGFAEHLQNWARNLRDTTINSNENELNYSVQDRDFTHEFNLDLGSFNDPVVISELQNLVDDLVPAIADSGIMIAGIKISDVFPTNLHGKPSLIRVIVIDISGKFHNILEDAGYQFMTDPGNELRGLVIEMVRQRFKAHYIYGPKASIGPLSTSSIDTVKDAIQKKRAYDLTEKVRTTASFGFERAPGDVYYEPQLQLTLNRNGIDRLVAVADFNKTTKLFNPLRHVTAARLAVVRTLVKIFRALLHRWYFGGSLLTHTDDPAVANQAQKAIDRIVQETSAFLNDSDTGRRARRLLKGYEVLPDTARHLLFAYVKLTKKIGLNVGEIRLYWVGGRVKGNPLRPFSDIDLIFEVQKPNGQYSVSPEQTHDFYARMMFFLSGRRFIMHPFQLGASLFQPFSSEEPVVDRTRILLARWIPSNGARMAGTYSTERPSRVRITNLPRISSIDSSVNKVLRVSSISSLTIGWNFITMIPHVLEAGYRVLSVKSWSWVRKILLSSIDLLNRSPFLRPLRSTIALIFSFLSEATRRWLTSSSTRSRTEENSGNERVFRVLQGFGGEVESGLDVLQRQARIVFQYFFRSLPGLEELKHYIKRHPSSGKTGPSVVDFLVPVYVWIDLLSHVKSIAQASSQRNSLQSSAAPARLHSGGRLASSNPRFSPANLGLALPQYGTEETSQSHGARLASDTTPNLVINSGLYTVIKNIDIETIGPVLEEIINRLRRFSSSESKDLIMVTVQKDSGFDIGIAPRANGGKYLRHDRLRSLLEIHDDEGMSADFDSENLTIAAEKFQTSPELYIPGYLKTLIVLNKALHTKVNTYIPKEVRHIFGTAGFYLDLTEAARKANLFLNSNGARLAVDTGTKLVFGVRTEEIRQAMISAIGVRATEDIDVVRLPGDREDDLRILNKEAERRGAFKSVFIDGLKPDLEVQNRILKEINEVDLSEEVFGLVIGEISQAQFEKLAPEVQDAVRERIFAILPSIRPVSFTDISVSDFDVHQAAKEIGLNLFSKTPVAVATGHYAAVYSAGTVQDPLFFERIENRNRRLTDSTMTIEDYLYLKPGETVGEDISQRFKGVIHSLDELKEFERPQILLVDNAEPWTDGFQSLEIKGNYSAFAAQDAIVEILSHGGEESSVLLPGLTYYNGHWVLELTRLDLARQFRRFYLTKTESEQAA